MKTRNKLYDKSRLRLLCLLTVLLGLFGAGQTWAGNPTTLTVGGTDVLNGGYWTTNADGTLTPDGASADNYNVYYDGNGTLTLKDANITGDSSTNFGAGIHAVGDLTIVLEGSSTVTGVVCNDESRGINTLDGNLTIQGGGSLTARGADTSRGGSYGIDVYGSFTQQGGSVTAIAGNVSGSNPSSGLNVSGTVTVKGGTLTATGGSAAINSSYGISAYSSVVTVSDATVTATSGSAGYASYGLYIESSSPSVTLSGSSSLTARSGSATDTAGGICFKSYNSTGYVTVGDNSTLLANSVILRASSDEKPLAPTGNGSWLIYGQSNQPSAVGGTYTLTDDLTIPSDAKVTIPAGSTLTVPTGITLTVEGTLNNGGTLSIAAETCLAGSGSLEGNGSFTATADAEVTGIEVPEGVTCANYQETVVMGGPTVLGQPFAAEGWTLTFVKGACTLGGCTYTATASKAGSEFIETTFTAQHNFNAEGKCPCGASLPQTDAQGRYQLADAFQLRWFAALVNGTLEGTALNAAASAVLTTNIDLTGADWTPIGNASTIYTGTFDGQNHTISGMTIENAESYSGLFGNVTGTVRDFTVTGSITITGDETVSRVGGAVGSLGTASVGGTVSGVTSGVNITVSAGNDHIGGVVGSMPENSSPTVESCVYTGNITVTVEAGSVAGVVGYIRTGTIQNCANRGGINTGGNGSVGGILGYCNNGNIYIRNCYNSGSIAAEGTANVGAIVGQNKKTQATVSNCYYLTGSADKGQGQLDTDAVGTVVKDDNAFTSGEVACLLQGDQTVQVWGQTLGRDDFPVLTTDEAMRVYAAKLYKGSADDATDVYANASGISLPEGNALLVIEDAVSATTGTNIVVKSGEAYTCANLVLTDGADFYTPYDFTAAQATYSRPLAEGTQWGTVALPFDATSVTGAELFRVDRQDGDALYVDETNGMADGEPLVFRANAEVTEVDFKGVNVAVRATDDEAGSTLLKGTSQTVSQLDAGAYFIYGDKFYRVASGSQVGMKPFRAYIPATAGASTRSAGAASQLRIVFNASETTRTAHEGN